VKNLLGIMAVVALLAVPALAAGPTAMSKTVTVGITVEPIAEISVTALPRALVYSSGTVSDDVLANISWRSNCNIDISVGLQTRAELPKEIWFKIYVKDDSAVQHRAEWKNSDAGDIGADVQVILPNLAAYPTYGTYRETTYHINGGSGFPAAPGDYPVIVVWTVAEKS